MDKIKKIDRYEISKTTLPLVPLRGVMVIPGAMLSFDVGRPASVKAIEKAMENEEIFVISQKDPEVERPGVNDLEEVGVICNIKQVVSIGEGAIRVVVEGVKRAMIEKFNAHDSYVYADLISFDLDSSKIPENEKMELEAKSRTLITNFKEFINIGTKISKDAIGPIENIEDYSEMVDAVASAMRLKTEDKNKIINTIDISDRMDVLYEMIVKEIEIVSIEKKVGLKLKKQINKFHKESYLREQIKSLQQELGEDDDSENKVEEFTEKLSKIKAPKETKKKIEREIKKFARTSPSSPEFNVSREYLDTIFSLPWNKTTRDSLDIAKATEILDEDHYGMEEVKERIIEFLAVRKLSKNLKSPIVCLYGPPGVGKTSIAKSIARAMNRKFVRLSLGGVRDEAEIRGHRRTYIGSIPGRIINAMIEANSKNPVFLFDEIDKMASDFRGDPASALLEVLDPEQNKNFVDHYLEIPFDLSNVMFLTTANNIETIPRPLYDRMEVINLEGYIEKEKYEIAKRYLIPKQVRSHGLKDDFITMDEEVVRYIINDYTREAGVRSLERCIEKICRKVVRMVVENPDMKPIVITKEDVDKFLVDKAFEGDNYNDDLLVGCVNGMGWTPVGGTSVKVEVNVVNGSGQITLTGGMGDTMKESARAGVSYIRSVADKYDIEEDFYKTKDIHIHLPKGGIQKDGPSAGITMALAVLSALTNRPVSQRFAMTGEITIRGNVMAIGGFREKTLAAHRAGARKIILPKDNEKDIEKIPEEVREELEFFPVEHMSEVINIALSESKGEKKSATDKDKSSDKKASAKKSSARKTTRQTKKSEDKSDKTNSVKKDSESDVDK